MLSVRFAPIFPFNAVNYLFGLTPLHWTTYTLGTALGILPGSLVCSWLGASGERALQQGQLGPFWVALSLLALLSLLPLGWRQQPASRASGVSRMGDRDSSNPRKWYSMQPLRTLSDFGTSLFHRDYRWSAVRVALVVGTILMAINHGSALLQGNMKRQRWYWPLSPTWCPTRLTFTVSTAIAANSRAS